MAPTRTHQFSRCSHVPLDAGRISQQGEDRQPSVRRLPGKRTESDRAKCVDTRPEKAAERDGNVRLSAHPSARRWSGPRPYRIGTPTVDVGARGTGAREAHNEGGTRVAIAEDLAIIHDPDGGPGVPRRAARDRLHPGRRALGDPAGHRRHVGRRERPDRVLHLRRHPDDLRLHVRPGADHHRHRATSPTSCSGCAAAGSRDRDDRVRHQPGPLRAERLAGRSPSSTGSPRSASRSKGSSSSSAPRSSSRSRPGSRRATRPRWSSWSCAVLRPGRAALPRPRDHRRRRCAC